MSRRFMTVPAVATLGVVLVVGAPLWIPLALIVDLVRARRRFPLVRLLAFATAWAWLELVGVGVAVGLWLVGGAGRLEPHYRLQRWWAGRMMDALRSTCGVEVAVEGAEAFEGGPSVLLCRHASLADALISAWVVMEAGRRPRYVLKRELLADPCLDIVGNRLPNHFVDREATDSTPELAAMSRLAAGMGPNDVTVIFPEGTRANPAKRRRALERIGERDPQRALRLADMAHLLPPRPAGTRALLEGAPTADVVIGWHVGFDGLDSFGGILRALSRPFPPARFVVRRIPRSQVPEGDGLAEWLDTQWLALDQLVGDALVARSHRIEGATR